MRNPVIERELIGALRTGKAAAMQIATAVVCSLLVLLRWPTEGHADAAGEQSRQVFRLFGYGLFSIILLLVPPFPATALVGERIRGTLALLLQTPLRPWSIYSGKLAGVVGLAFLLLCASLPAAAACYVMGGLSLLGEIVPLYGVLALAAVQYSVVGLFVSSRARSLDSALRATYGLVLILAILTLGPYQLVQGQRSSVVVGTATWVRSLSPLPALMEVLGDSGAGGQGLAPNHGYGLRYSLLALASIAGLATATLLRLRPTSFDRPRPAGPITDERTTMIRGLRRLFFVVDPQRRSGLIGPFTNPVLIKEFRSGRFGRLHWQLRLVAACAIGTLGLTYLWSSAALDWGTGTIAALMILLQGALIVLLTPSLAAGLISAEIESGGWTLLKTTPLGAGRILRGKLLSVTGSLALILFATLPGYGVLVYARPALVQQISDVLVCLVLTALFALALSAAVGSLFRRTAPATVAVYALLLAICGGPLLVWLGRDTTFGHPVVENALMISPLAAAMTVMQTPGFAHYRLVPGAWWVTGMATLLCLFVLRVRVWRLTRALALVVTFATWPFLSPSACALEPDFARAKDPAIELDENVKIVPKFHPRLKPLWLEALTRPEADLKRQAADALARARKLGMPGLEDTVPHLLSELEAPDAHPLVRLAVGRALIALNARQAAPALMKQALSGGMEAASFLEPALANWDYAPMREVWLVRLKDAQAPRGPLLLAIDAAATVKLLGAIPELRRLALDPKTTADIRLRAARALAELQTSGLEQDVALLLTGASPSISARLVAVSLLSRQRGSGAEALLLRLGADPNPAVAVIAARRLLEISPVLVKPLTGALLSSQDSDLRLLAARALETERSPEAVARLARLLDDPHRAVRRLAQESLIRVAGMEPLRQPVFVEVTRALTNGGPHGLEQAALVVGALRHEPAAGRLVQLLDSRHSEVRVSAAWALRRLALPATAAAILERVRRETDLAQKTPADENEAQNLFLELEHLIEALGTLHHRPALPVLRKYVPAPPLLPPPGVVKATWQPQLRAAALWSMSYLRSPDDKRGFDQGADALVPMLRGCLERESGAVAAMAAVSLGRLKAKEAVPLMRNKVTSEKEGIGVRRACAWAVEQITGEVLPAIPIPVREHWHGNWFLVPLGEP